MSGLYPQGISLSNESIVQVTQKKWWLISGGVFRGQQIKEQGHSKGSGLTPQ